MTKLTDAIEVLNDYKRFYQPLIHYSHRIIGIFEFRSHIHLYIEEADDMPVYVRSFPVKISEDLDNIRQYWNEQEEESRRLIKEKQEREVRERLAKQEQEELATLRKLQAKYQGRTT